MNGSIRYFIVLKMPHQFILVIYIDYGSCNRTALAVLYAEGGPALDPFFVPADKSIV